MMIQVAPGESRPAAVLPYVASGACSSCPYRASCHEARRRVQDARFAVGRQYDCEFHQEFVRLERMPAPRLRWWRLFGGGR